MNYLTTTQAAKSLGMSRQNFWQSGLALAIPSEGVARTRLYDKSDLSLWRSWLSIRRGLIALGILPPNTSLNIGHEGVKFLIDSGEWISACPVCGGWAVTDTRILATDTRTWCPEHHLQEG